MALIARTHIIKAALFVGLLLLLLNFYNYLPQSKFDTGAALSIVHFKTFQWPKRTRSSSTFSNNSVAIFRNDTRDPNAANTNATATNTFSKYTSISHTNNNNNTTNNSKKKVIIAKQHVDLVINSSKSNNVINTLALNNTQASNATDSYLEQLRNNVRAETSTKTSFFHTLMTTLSLGVSNYCPLYPPSLDGPVKINTTVEKLTVLEERLRPTLLPGGWYKPKNCIAKDRVALIIPYRDRAMHLPVFLANIHPFLQKQQNEYGIFLIEQISDGLFNRASLLNVGYVEALKFKDWDCFIFHDIDLLPMDDRNLYNCPDQPRHMSYAVDTFQFKLPYSSIFGGVSAMTRQQFKTVNGFSNSFWGWGGEDDDMSNRLTHFGYHIARYPINIARYKMLSHKKEKPNPNRYQKLENGVKSFDVDGLNSLKYKIHYLERKVLYTWVLVELKQNQSS